MAYWQPHIIDGNALDLSHLEPFLLECEVKNLDRILTIEVKYTNHCFTENFVDGKHDPARKIMDHKRPRAFDQTRYDLSFKLPDLVLGLPQTAVWQTPERNFMNFLVVQDGSGCHYPMFFRLKRANKTVYLPDADDNLAAVFARTIHLELIVESAYPIQSAKELIDKSSKVRFPILCAKVFQGQKVEFKARR